MWPTVYLGLKRPRQLPSSGSSSGSGTGAGGGGIAFEPVVSFATIIDYPEAKDYILDVYADFPGTIDEIVAITSSGTCTAVAKINTTNVTGTSISVSSTINSGVATAANTFVAGDKIKITLSVLSNPRNVAIKIRATRTGL